MPFASCRKSFGSRGVLFTADLDALSADGVAGLTPEQVATLDATEIAALGTDIANLSSTTLGSLTTDQVAALTSAQVAGLTASQLDALAAAGTVDDLGTDAASINPTSLAGALQSTRDALASLTGNSGNDTLVGSALANTLLGMAGNDSLDGGAGNDTITGGAGADTLIGGAGTDTLTYSSDTAGVNINLAMNTASGGEAQGDVIGGFESAQGGLGNDTIVGDANGSNLQGNAGNDSIDGGDGNDSIMGGAGADTLIGGAGLSDILRYDNDTAGIDINLATNTASGGDAQGDVISGFEWCICGGGNDRIVGDANANAITGAAGNDTLDGGGAGNDTLNGGAGTDTFKFSVHGTSGDAGNGVDLIADTFQSNKDAVLDAGEDKLDLSAIFSALGIAVNAGNVTTYLKMNGTTLQIDRDGAGASYSFTNLVMMTGTTIADADLANLVTAGQIVL